MLEQKMKKNSLDTLFTHLSFDLINIYNRLTQKIYIKNKGQKCTFIFTLSTFFYNDFDENLNFSLINKW